MPALPDDLTRAENIARGFGAARDQSARPIDAEQINTLRSAVHLMARQGEELASLVARMLDQPPELRVGLDPSGASGVVTIPVPGSVERLNQELAAAHARNAELQEELDGIRGDGGIADIRAQLHGTDVWDVSASAASMVARLVERVESRRRLVEEQGERIRNALDALTPPF